MATETMPVGAEVHDTFPINGTDYIEFYVGNGKQAAHYYRVPSDSSSLRIVVRKRGRATERAICSQQDKIRLVLTTPIDPDSEIAEHVRVHGDGVRDIALWVDDARDAYQKAVDRGAVSA